MIDTTKKIAFVFSGQGSQSVGMLKEAALKFPYVKETFSKANEILGYDLWQLTQEGPAEKLNQTEYAQPALVTAGFALWQVWQKQNPDVCPVFLAGHSLGEYTALVCAGALTFSDALKLVVERGRLMQEAVPVGQGAMLAIIGLTDEVVNNICKEASQTQVLSPANYNAPGQTVLAGTTAAVQRAVTLAQKAGAKLVKILPVSVPAHCQLMQPIAETFAERLQQISLKPPQIPVIHNVDVVAYKDAGAIRDALVRQLFSPVRWVETILFFAQNGVDTIIECGPGKVLAGLNKRIVPDLEVYSLSINNA